MYRKTNRILSVVLSFFLCFAHAYTPVFAEGEEIPEQTPEGEILEVTEEAPEVVEEPSEEEVPEVTEEVTEEQEEEEISEEDIKYFSIENRITPDFPPSFVWHTATDNAVPVMNSLLLCEQFAKNGVRFELHVYPEGPHGVALSNHITDNPNKTPAPAKPRAWVKECVDFLDNIAYNK